MAMASKDKDNSMAQIRVNNVEKENKGKYNRLIVSYDKDGKTQKMQLVSFGDYEHIYKLFEKANAGDYWEVKSKQIDGYWKWVEAKKVDGATNVGGTAPAGRTGGQWETAEERAKKQVYIVRQSSISAAIEVEKYNAMNGAGVGASHVDIDDVLDTARKFEAYVFGLGGNFTDEELATGEVE